MYQYGCEIEKQLLIIIIIIIWFDEKKLLILYWLVWYLVGVGVIKVIASHTFYQKKEKLRLTPVSASIHATTMVKAGVFMIARCSPLFEYPPTLLE